MLLFWIFFLVEKLAILHDFHTRNWNLQFNVVVNSLLFVCFLKFMEFACFDNWSIDFWRLNNSRNVKMQCLFELSFFICHGFYGLDLVLYLSLIKIVAFFNLCIIDKTCWLSKINLFVHLLATIVIFLRQLVVNFGDRFEWFCECFCAYPFTGVC
jgi:hypothetical protein